MIFKNYKFVQNQYTFDAKFNGGQNAVANMTLQQIQQRGSDITTLYVGNLQNQLASMDSLHFPIHMTLLRQLYLTNVQNTTFIPFISSCLKYVYLRDQTQADQVKRIYFSRENHNPQEIVKFSNIENLVIKPITVSVEVKDSQQLKNTILFLEMNKKSGIQLDQVRCFKIKLSGLFIKIQIDEIIQQLININIFNTHSVILCFENGIQLTAEQVQQLNQSYQQLKNVQPNQSQNNSKRQANNEDKIKLLEQQVLNLQNQIIERDQKYKDLEVDYQNFKLFISREVQQLKQHNNVF